MLKKKRTPKGLIQVYTGDGKGKTTAALGLAMRASGHGRKVIIIQFMKGDNRYGEVRAVRRLRGVTLQQFGLSTFVKKGNPSNEDIRLASEGFRRAEEAVSGGRYDMVILDEIHVAVEYGLIPLENLLRLMQNKPDRVELVLTGRYAHPEVVGKAHLVSEIRNIKHPFSNGVSEREGIEF